MSCNVRPNISFAVHPPMASLVHRWIPRLEGPMTNTSQVLKTPEIDIVFSSQDGKAEHPLPSSSDYPNSIYS